MRIPVVSLPTRFPTLFESFWLFFVWGIEKSKTFLSRCVNARWMQTSSCSVEFHWPFNRVRSFDSLMGNPAANREQVQFIFFISVLISGMNKLQTIN